MIDLWPNGNSRIPQASCCILIEPSTEPGWLPASPCRNFLVYAETYSQHDPVAQLAEHLTFNQRVPGSSPGGITKRKAPAADKQPGLLHSINCLWINQESIPLADRTQIKANPST